MEPMTHGGDFREVKRRKRRYSDDMAETAKKSTISVPKSAAVKLPTKNSDNSFLCTSQN
jgi:hypothetical protein